MFNDFILAALHHLLVFALMAVIATEIVMARPGLSGQALHRLGRVDLFYGIIATAVIIVGVCRVMFGLKGWEAYAHNVWFWHKMAAFLIVALLSILPTIRLLRWRRAAAADPAFAVSDAEMKPVRRILHAEAAIFLLIPVFAAAMARYG